MINTNNASDSTTHRHAIVHFMTSQANISYQYDDYKGIINTSKTAGYQLPAHYFAGNTTTTIGECLVATNGMNFQ